jgi:hypothetical protein
MYKSGNSYFNPSPKWRSLMGFYQHVDLYRLSKAEEPYNAALMTEDAMMFGMSTQNT